MAVAIAARQRVREVREQLKVDRSGALAELDEIFLEGIDSYPLLDGRYSGQLLATTLGKGADALLDRLLYAWMPWKGKLFDIETCTGENLITTSGQRLCRLTFPRYHNTKPDHEGKFRAFDFRTYFAPSWLAPDQDVLKVDYDVSGNPSLIRRMLDEIIELGDGYYLGRSLIRRKQRWTCWAYFTLSEVFDPLPTLDWLPARYNFC